MKRPREFDANRYLRETRHRPPQRRSTDRLGWAEAIKLGLIVAVVIAAMSYGGQWLDSVVAGWVK